MIEKWISSTFKKKSINGLRWKNVLATEHFHIIHYVFMVIYILFAYFVSIKSNCIFVFLRKKMIIMLWISLKETRNSLRLLPDEIKLVKNFWWIKHGVLDKSCVHILIFFFCRGNKSSVHFCLHLAWGNRCCYFSKEICRQVWDCFHHNNSTNHLCRKTEAKRYFS